MRPRILSLFLSALLLLGVCSASYAQITPGGSTPVTQSGQRPDAATFLQGQANGAASCNAGSQTAAQDTVTITPPAGQFVYITGVYIDIVQNTGLGANGVATLSSTNLTGAPIWSLATMAGTTSGTGSYSHYQDTYPNGLKATVAGTAVTFVPSASMAATQITCIRVAGYFAPGP